MSPRVRVIVIALLASAASTAFAQEIPPRQRIPVTLVRTLTASDVEPMHMPTDVAVDARGYVYVADGVNHRIVRFNRDGGLEPELSLDTVVDGKTRAVGITVDAENRLWVADADGHRLLVLAQKDEPIETIALPAGEHPFEPTDVAVTVDGKRAYVVDNENHRIAIRDNASGAWAMIGKFGRAVGQFQWPFMIAVGPGGDVLISDVIGARVQRLRADDQWTAPGGRYGVELGELYRPKGVTVDREGRVYVSDSTLSVVQVFESSGRPAGFLTDADGNVMRFAHPMGLWLTPDGRLHVVELREGRVAVVQLPAGYEGPTTRPADEIKRDRK